MPGEIDGAEAQLLHVPRMIVEPLEGRRQHPAIEPDRQTVELGRRQERAGRHHVTELVLHA